MRMVDFPVGLLPRSIRPLGGRDVLGGSVSQTDFSQVVADPFAGLVKYEVTFPPLIGGRARAFDILANAAASGANCFRYQFRHRHEPSWAELGYNIASNNSTMTWADGQNWAHGEPWVIGKPLVPVKAASAKGSGTITFDASLWNGVVPSWFGVVGHFAVYRVEGIVFNGSDAVCRVWPPVRRAVTTSDFVTMRPTAAMRVTGPDGASHVDNLAATDNAKLTMAEVPDEVVRKYVTEDYPA